MSLPHTPLRHSPCAKPSAPHRSPFPAFQPLSSPPSSPSSSSPVTCFSFPSLAACPRGGGSSLQPNEVSLGLFYLPQITFFFGSPFAGNGAAAVPVTGGCSFAPRPVGPVLVPPAGSLPGRFGGAAAPGGCKAPWRGQDDVTRDARGFDHPVFCSFSFDFSLFLALPGPLLDRCWVARPPHRFWGSPASPGPPKTHRGLVPGSASQDGHPWGGSETVSPILQGGPLCFAGVTVPPFPDWGPQFPLSRPP